MKQADIYLVSSFPAEEVERMGLRPFASAAEAVDAALLHVGPGRDRGSHAARRCHRPADRRDLTLTRLLDGRRAES